jgi:hypothetical protein
MRTAGDLNAETLPLEEAASGRPELEPDPQAAIVLWRDAARSQAQDAVAEVG